MNSYEKARDEAALEKHPLRDNFSSHGRYAFTQGSDWANARLQPELEALRAAVRAAYEAFATIEKAILDFPRGGCYCEPEVNYSCEWCDFLDKLSPTLKTLKPFLEPGTPGEEGK